MENRHLGVSRSRLGVGLTTLFWVGVMSGCGGLDSLLEVQVFGVLTEDQVFQPNQATLIVNSVISEFECAYSDFTLDASGREDVFMRTSGYNGGWGNYSSAPGTRECNSTDRAFAFWNSFHESRNLAETTYPLMLDWAPADLLGDKEEMLATLATYTGLIYGVFGEHFCEMAIESGPLLTPDATLAIAEGWFDLALGHVSTAGDFEIGGGDMTTSALQLATLARARVRFARGDMANAAIDAAAITQGFKAYVTRDAAGLRQRQNKTMQASTISRIATVIPAVTWWPAGGGLKDADGFPTGPQEAFTGYVDLGVMPDGRAVSAEGFAVRTSEFPTAVADARVTVDDGVANDGSALQVAGFQYRFQQKYTSTGSDIPLANWEEAWLIMAQNEGGAAAVTRVNVIRAAHNLPLVTYAPNAAEVRLMIIEERRRSLFLEARFVSTKIREQLFFPRFQGFTPYSEFGHEGGVRLAMPTAEYDLNLNLDRTMRGTGCDPAEAPII